MTKLISTQPYKGARDFYPEDMRLRQYWEDESRRVVECFGYEPYDGPMVEPAALFDAKTSEEIVSGQTYRFTDRGGRDVLIRPEMTPTFARMVAARAGTLNFPLRWYSFPNLWRYERPQRGRLREHWQLNCDLVVPVLTPAYECEMFRMIGTLMGAFGAKPSDYVITYNHRGLCEKLFETKFKIKQPEQLHGVFYILDRSQKLTQDELENLIKEKNLSSFSDIKSFLEEARSPETAFQDLSHMPEHTEFMRFNALIAQSALSESIRFDPTVVRGFDYYTGLVFEVQDTHPDNRRAILGGGRYDNLIGMFSTQKLQGIGFGWGDVTFKDFLTTHGLLNAIKDDPASTCVILACDEEAIYANTVQDKLLSAKIHSRLLVSPADKMFKTGLKNALRYSTKYLLIIGANEREQQTVTVKNTTTRHEDSVSLTELVTYIS